MKTKQFLRTIFLCFTLLTFNYSCDMLEEEEEVEATTTNEKPGYNYTFTCPSGTKSTVPIPKGSEKCQKAQEYFAKIYGCNEADYFNQANCRVCNDCGWTNYCSVCK